MTNNVVRTYASGLNSNPFFIKYKTLYNHNDYHDFFGKITFDQDIVDQRIEELKEDYDLRTLGDFINDLDRADYDTKEERIEHAEEQYREYLEERKTELEQQVRGNLKEALTYWTIYFEPLCFDIDIALKCGLTPFTYYSNSTDELELLALSGCGMDLSPKLEAYQALTHKTVDKYSTLYQILNGRYENDPKDKWNEGKCWASVVGQDVLEEIKLLFGLKIKQNN